MLSEMILAMLAAASTMPPVSDLESVFDMRQDATGITVQVRSNGCTEASSFKVHLADSAGKTMVALERERPDYCRAFLRDGVTLHWDWKELGITPPEDLVLVNPVVGGWTAPPTLP